MVYATIFSYCAFTIWKAKITNLQKVQKLNPILLPTKLTHKMKTIFRSLVLLAVIAPAVFLSSCGGDDTPTTPSTPTNECVIATDSSTDGTTIVTANSNNQITGVSNAFLNATFISAGDSTYFTFNEDTIQIREVFYKNGSNWAKSVQTISSQSSDFPGATLQSISTTTPTYSSGKISSLRTTQIVGARVGSIFTPIGTTQTTDYSFTYNADGNITRVVKTENGSSTNYNYTYASNTVSKANVFLFDNAFSESLPMNFLPVVLGYFVPFSKMITKMDYPDGSITFSNVTTDSKNNVSRYTMLGTGDESGNSGKVKTTYVCK
jgi:hypothetical protein